MSSNRTILSRPRTRVYDCNYNIGQSYYKPMVDHLDRKYSGRLSEMPPAYPACRQPNQEEVDLFRTRRSGPEMDFPSTDMRDMMEEPATRRKPAGSALDEFDDIFENRPTARNGGVRGPGPAIANGRNGFSSADDALEDVSSSMKRLRVSRAQRLADELDEEMDAVVQRRRNQVAMKVERETSLADRALESVGLRKVAASDLDDDFIIKKRTLRITQESASERTPELTKWSKVAAAPTIQDSPTEAAAISRALKTRNRLQDLESEMEELAERSAIREKRAAQLRSLVAETADRSDEEVSSVRVKSSLRSEKKSVQF